MTTRGDGVRVFYRLANEHVPQLVTDAIFQAEHSLGGTPRHHHRPQESAQMPREGAEATRGSAGSASGTALR